MAMHCGMLHTQRSAGNGGERGRQTLPDRDAATPRRGKRVDLTDADLKLVQSSYR